MTFAPLPPITDTSPLLDLDSLPPEELRLIQDVQARVLGVVQSNRSQPTEPKESPSVLPWPLPQRSRQHRTIFINGHRGTGKTSILLTLIHNWNQPNAKDVTSSFFTHTHGAVRACPIIDFDDLPPDLTAHAAICLATYSVIEWIQEYMGEQRPSSRSKWERTYRDIQAGWGPFPENGLAEDMDELVLQRRNRHARWTGLRDGWQTFVESIFADLHQAGQPLEALIIPIDDIDLHPHRANELMHALRALHHPGIIYLLAGNIRNLEGAIALDVSRASHSAGRPGEEDRRLARDILEKVIPSPLRLNMNLWSLAETVEKNSLERLVDKGVELMKYTPTNNLESIALRSRFGLRVREITAFCEQTRKEVEARAELFKLCRDRLDGADAFLSGRNNSSLRMPDTSPDAPLRLAPKFAGGHGRQINWPNDGPSITVATSVRFLNRTTKEYLDPIETLALACGVGFEDISWDGGAWSSILSTSLYLPGADAHLRLGWPLWRSAGSVQMVLGSVAEFRELEVGILSRGRLSANNYAEEIVKRWAYLQIISAEKGTSDKKLINGSIDLNTASLTDILGVGMSHQPSLSNGRLHRWLVERLPVLAMPEFGLPGSLCIEMISWAHKQQNNAYLGPMHGILSAQRTLAHENALANIRDQKHTSEISASDIFLELEMKFGFISDILVEMFDLGQRATELYTEALSLHGIARRGDRWSSMQLHIFRREDPPISAYELVASGVPRKTVAEIERYVVDRLELP